MNANIRCLISACKKANVRYKILHESKNVVTLKTPRGCALFANWTTPLNSHSVSRLCEDKDFSYAALSPLVRMPRTEAFLNPEVDKKYQDYVSHPSTAEIVFAVEESFEYPLIVKRNRGSHGSNVFRVSNRPQLTEAIAAVFNQESRYYDYVVLAQEDIEIEREYRAIFLDGEYVFAYEKDTTGATFTGNLSPFYRDGTKAIRVKSKKVMRELDEFMQPVFANFDIPFCGADIALDGKGRLWMIEINSAPGFHHFVRDEGPAEVEELYARMLEKLAAGSLK